MNVAFYTYGDTDNEGRLPSEWPCELRELGDGNDPPDTGHPWQVMTLDQYRSYVAARQHLYAAWEAANPKPVPPAEPDPYALIAELQAQIDALKAQIQG